MTEKPDIQLLLQKVDLEAAGREIARHLVDWLARPENLKLIEAIQGLTGKQRKEPAEPEKDGRRRKGPRICSEPGCDGKVSSKGLCAKHYQRKRYKERGPRPGAVRGIRDCMISGCDRKVHARGMCGAHFMEWVRAKRSQLKGKGG